MVMREKGRVGVGDLLARRLGWWLVGFGMYSGIFGSLRD
jgi:hypothetical protein